MQYSDLYVSQSGSQPAAGLNFGKVGLLHSVTYLGFLYTLSEYTMSSECFALFIFMQFLFL